MPMLPRSLLAFVSVLALVGPLAAQIPAARKVGAPASSPGGAAPVAPGITAGIVGGHDHCAVCSAIGGFGTFAFDLTAATTGAQGQTEALCNYFQTTGIANDVWFCWTATVTGIMEFSTCGLTSVDTKCAVYSAAGGGCPTGPALACNDDACASLQTMLCLPVTAGTTYSIQLGVYPSAAPGTGSFTIVQASSCCQPPSILTQPQNATACNGGSTTLSVTATGTGTLSYQWYRDGGAVSGGTSASLVTSTAGTYFVTVTNACSSATSVGVTVSVANSPSSTISPVGFAGCPGQLGTTLTATPNGGGPYTYQWTRNGVAINGAIGVSHATGPLSASTIGTYRVVVTNVCGTATSLNSCSVSMYAPVSITLQPASQSTCVGGGVTFVVAATGQPTIGYQWRRNGVAIGGANGASFSIPVVTTGDAGAYTCTCTNTCGPVTSAAATLTVLTSQGITSLCACDAGNGPCFATSTGTPGNPAPNGGAGRGCVNSMTASAGARLEASGVAAVSSDSLVLTVTGVPDSPAVLYQSSTSASPVFSNDGLWCLGSPATLLCATTSGSAGGFAANQAAYPNSACTASLSVLGSVPGGATRLYQVRYKDYGDWCTSATSNSTSALSIVWCP